MKQRDKKIKIKMTEEESRRVWLAVDDGAEEMVVTHIMYPPDGIEKLEESIPLKDFQKWIDEREEELAEYLLENIRLNGGVC